MLLQMQLILLLQMLLQVKPNVLASFSGGSQVFQRAVMAGRVGAVFMVVGVYPLMMKPMIAPLYALRQSFESEPESGGLTSNLLPSPSSDAVNTVAVMAIRDSQRIQVNSRLGAPWVVPVVSVGVVGAAMAVAFLVESLGVVIVINGALGAIGFVSVGPFLVGTYLVESGRACLKASAFKPCLYVLLVAGSALSVLGFFFSDNFAGDIDPDTGTCLWSHAN
jgi:hypothetical protein